ncbi:hypothetical protein BTJ49_07595 [Oleiagrimonas sp. MCCC 1A03011]|nr:hypothetical protein BTJ49_07595 [Oleiagrimonas sp. MCCC 1A03011]
MTSGARHLEETATMKSSNETLKRILAKLGEGLVIGVGVAIVIGLYTSMSNATDELRRADERLQKQVQINQMLKNQLEASADQTNQVNKLFEQVNKTDRNIASLAERVKTLENSPHSDKKTAQSQANYDWGKFHPAPPPRLPISALDSATRSAQLQSIQSAINEQKAIK